MDFNLHQIENEIRAALLELIGRKPLNERHILVVGASTSEVLGVHIGKGGSGEVAAALFRGIQAVQGQHRFHLAFQCCEHLNRALVVERETQERFGLTEVSVVPIPSAGGAMATYAFDQFAQPVVVEQLQADAGIDIGSTFIGMHLKPVVVPVRPMIRYVGSAHITMAFSRPKLIGGERAVYQRNTSCSG